MIHELQIRTSPREAYDERGIIAFLQREKGLRADAVQVLKRSIDARQRTIYVNLTVRAFVGEKPKGQDFDPIIYPDVSDRPSVIVVGAGPGGLFAALRLIELGLRPIVVERGKDVRERKKDLARIRPEQKVDAESNYSFGEGGAGAYSDGKLFTRSKKRGDSDKILRVFVQHGANPNIMVDAHPHIGTDCLPRVIENMRKTILSCGGEVHFQTKMTSLILDNGVVKGIRCEEKEFLGTSVILATGHSARDVYRYLRSENIDMEAKGLAIGVRLEHPSHLIDQIQYHSPEGRGKWLPAAEYSMVRQVANRGVYSFCMCPGGVVVPAASGPEQIVVNGMSPSHRGGKWSNSGMVVEVRPEDILPASLITPNQVKSADIIALESTSESVNPAEMADDVLRPLLLQEQLERMCWLQGNRSQTAPAQRMADFVNNRLSASLNESSYAPGLIASPLHFWMPRFITTRLQEGFKAFGRSYRGFLTNDANMIAIETRTSAPIRILRDRENLQHVSILGLFPCGEGAGYAGGIVSAGVDGERCAEMASQYHENT
ncbi:MAG: FAD-binding protein [Bacteroidaceae bacterium]|nr:FAD-binding protein [Bacteroidaceae bacterium]